MRPLRRPPGPRFPRRPAADRAAILFEFCFFGVLCGRRRHSAEELRHIDRLHQKGGQGRLSPFTLRCYLRKLPVLKAVEQIGMPACQWYQPSVDKYVFDVRPRVEDIAVRNNYVRHLTDLDRT